MSDFSLDYNVVQEACKAAQKAASASRNYTYELKNKVSDKLDRLEDGGSGYTDNAGYFAARKIRQLEERADRYDQYAQKLNCFLDGAKNTDARVAGSIRADSVSFRRSNNMSVNPVIDFFTWLTTTVINKSDFAKWLKDVFTDVGNWIGKGWNDLKYWYKCDGGKYIVNFIVSAVLTVVAAAVIIFIAWPAVLAATTVWSTIVAAAGLVGAMITLADRVVACIHDKKALDTNGEDPSWAKRYDGINSISGFFTKVRTGNRFLDRLSYKIANLVNAVSSVCAIITLSDFAKTSWSVMKNKQWKADFKKLVSDKHKWRDKYKGVKELSKDFKDMTTMKKLKNTVKNTARFSTIYKIINKIEDPISKIGGSITQFNSEGLWNLMKDKAGEYTYKKSTVLSNLEKVWKKTTAIKYRKNQFSW